MNVYENRQLSVGMIHLSLFSIREHQFVSVLTASISHGFLLAVAVETLGASSCSAAIRYDKGRMRRRGTRINHIWYMLIVGDLIRSSLLNEFF
jgi:hypothetical protein